MLSKLTLDQLRVLVAVADTGSFSAAGRALFRVQSAVSTSVANAERTLGVALWDRTARTPVPTPEGALLLDKARRVLAEVDELEGLAQSMSEGVEARVSLCVEALLPLAALVGVCTAFAKAFPRVDLVVDTQTLSAVSARVRDGSATLGVVSAAGLVAGVEAEALSVVRMVPVVAPGHPLARARGPLPTRALAEHVQLVLSEQRGDGGIPDQGVLSSRTWRVGDLHTKHALLLAGLGWGNLPAHLCRDDLARGRLVRIRPKAWREDEHVLTLSAIFLPRTADRPAHTWLRRELARRCTDESGPPTRRRRV